MITKPEADWRLILEKTRPGQSIGAHKLIRNVLDNALSYDKFHAAMRHLRKEGLATLKRRPGHADGSLITFHKEPLPEAKRDKVDRGPYIRHEPEYPDASQEEFAVQEPLVYDATVVYSIVGGDYTADDLRELARAVLTELGELS